MLISGSLTFSVIYDLRIRQFKGSSQYAELRAKHFFLALFSNNIYILR